MQKKMLFPAVCFLYAVLLSAACNKTLPVERENPTGTPVVTGPAGQTTTVPSVTKEPDPTGNPKPTKNPWLSEPDWEEKPEYPAKDFFPGALTGEEQQVGYLPGNMTIFGYVCENDGYLYYSDKSNDERHLCRERIDGDGSGKQVLAEEKMMCFGINVMGDYVYYLTGGMVKRIPKDGGEAEILWDKGVNSLAVTGDKIYFLFDGVYSMNQDGSGVKRLTARGAVKGDDKGITAISVYRDYILYLADRDNLSMYAVKNDGSEEYLLLEKVYWTTVAGDVVYFPLREDALEYYPEFQEEDAGKIIEFSLVTGEKRVVSERKGVVSGVIGDRLYYSDYHSIRVVSLTDGTEEAFYPAEQDDPKELLKHFYDLLFVTSNRLYYLSGGLRYVDLETGVAGTMK